MRPIQRPLALAVLAFVPACVSVTQDTAPPQTANVRTFGNAPAPDDASRTGITAAVQTYTPDVHAKATTPLRALWSAKIGRTNHRTTMALVGSRVVIGTHGGSVDAKEEAEDGVYVIDGPTGAIERVIATPGRGDRDVNGIAVDGERVFFTTDNGLVVAASIGGPITWTSTIGGEVLPAPALVDANGDGAMDAVVGDQSGRLNVIDGKTGRKLWSRPCGVESTSRNGFEAAVAIGDLDGDGASDIVAGSWTGALGAFRARDGEPIWVQYAPKTFCVA